jgi:hypothetical protein
MLFRQSDQLAWVPELQGCHGMMGATMMGATFRIVAL